jgi:hypothetical protein
VKQWGTTGGIPTFPRPLGLSSHLHREGIVLSFSTSLVLNNKANYPTASIILPALISPADQLLLMSPTLNRKNNISKKLGKKIGYNMSFGTLKHNFV